MPNNRKLQSCTYDTRDADHSVGRIAYVTHPGKLNETDTTCSSFITDKNITFTGKPCFIDVSSTIGPRKCYLTQCVRPIDTQNSYLMSVVRPIDANHTYLTSVVQPTDANYTYLTSVVHPTDKNHTYLMKVVRPTDTNHTYLMSVARPIVVNHTYLISMVGTMAVKQVFGMSNVKPYKNISLLTQSITLTY